eukprot:jgi/Picsp_1/6091/NSC_03445-R1_nudix hydrolase
MEKEDEIFEIVNEENTVVGQEYRGIVHRKGLLHRAVYCWVFNTEGLVLLQKRSPLKNIGPSQWDLSLAEHLQPGESFREAVIRGLGEELGIFLARGREQQLVGPITDVHRRELHVGEFHDIELVQSFRLENFSGQINFEDDEVVDIKWVNPEMLSAMIGASPGDYTEWLQGEALYLKSNMAGAKERDE